LIDLKPTLILLFGLSFAACTQGEGETLLEARFALAGELPAFDPMQSEQSTYQVLQRQVFETLTEYVPNGESGAVQPLLAESWKISENGLTWTFELREEAFFYDPWPNFNKDRLDFFCSHRSRRPPVVFDFPESANRLVSRGHGGDL
jgi:ABC-type transport system substrate-binding protein